MFPGFPGMGAMLPRRCCLRKHVFAVSSLFLLRFPCHPFHLGLPAFSIHMAWSVPERGTIPGQFSGVHPRPSPMPERWTTASLEAGPRASVGPGCRGCSGSKRTSNGEHPRDSPTVCGVCDVAAGGPSQNDNRTFRGFKNKNDGGSARCSSVIHKPKTARKQRRHASANNNDAEAWHPFWESWNHAPGPRQSTIVAGLEVGAPVGLKMRISSGSRSTRIAAGSKTALSRRIWARLR